MNAIPVQTRPRRLPHPVRRELAAWQRAALGLFALSLAVNLALYGLYIKTQEHLEKETALLQAQLTQARAVRDQAVTALGELTNQVTREREARAAQAEAYAAIGTYRYVGECKLTAYCCEAYEHICGTGDGLTAAGLPVAPGIVAVDPEVIPLGSVVVIDGQRYLAADTGGAVKGLHIDIAVETHQQADAFGVQEAVVWVVDQ